MKKGRLLRIIGLILIVLFIGIQFIPVDRSVREADPGADFLRAYEMPDEFYLLVRDACYDCHSNEVEYPWYAKVAPVSFWIQQHVDEGREHLNFSTWSSYDIAKRLEKMQEMAEEVEEGHMPLKSFTWMHPEARLTDEERADLVGWFESLSH